MTDEELFKIIEESKKPKKKRPKEISLELFC